MARAEARESAAPAPAPAANAGQHVVLGALSKSFGASKAVDDFSLAVTRGSFTTLLGPSGCGKTTVLRMLAGFIEPDAGTVVISGRDQGDLPPNLRGVGMVFQDYALFPHMSVRSNVEYGLRMRHLPANSRRERANRALELLDLIPLERRFPHELSGGQQQRVALGRVIALEPEVLLMDEPLSNLDAKLRLRLRGELKALQRRLGITTIYVTHDQEEALSLSDRVVVMDRGRLQQEGSPEEVYHAPANQFVADFVGHANLLPVEVVEVAAGAVTARALGRQLRLRLPDGRLPPVGSTGTAMVRPEQVVLGLGAAAGAASSATDAAWSVSARVESAGFFGAFHRYWLKPEGLEQTWLVDVPAAAGLGAPRPGASLELSVPASAACWLW